MVNGYRHSYALLKIKNRVLCWWDGLGINEDVSYIHFLSHYCQTRSLYAEMVWVAKEHPECFVINSQKRF